MDSDGVDHFRIVDGDRLMWESPETTWAARPQRFAGAVKRRIRTIFPVLGDVEIADMFGGAIGQTVHGMPQIGQLRQGLWVASGFGRQGMNTSAMAGQLIARGICDGRRALAAVLAVRAGLGGQRRPAGSPGQLIGVWGRASLRRRRLARPLPGTGASQGDASAKHGSRKPTGPRGTGPRRSPAWRRPRPAPDRREPAAGRWSGAARTKSGRLAIS